MDNAIYANLSRMEGLKAELQVIANNLANISTPGFKREGMIFSEFLVPLEEQDVSLSMAHGEVRRTDFSQGPIRQTGNPFDFAIDGPGFFLVEHEGGQALTRAGNFAQNANGELVTMGGKRVLDAGGAPVQIPPGAGAIRLSADGTLSADGQFLSAILPVVPAQGEEPERVAEMLFTVESAPVPAENSRVLQGFKEDSNVEAVLEIARMIEVHRAYEQGASLNKSEDERIRNVLRTLGA
ncbi:flagellar hook-basal body complex protein [Mangrovicoccus algicola]|uniref:Flagellar basal-body rod protein FlgF n=1 Tax=Mangrovicoccus algicola TaxID=2771008 RepID=A0A8J6Z1Z8_9RHOB|nr:flagellar hook-basal body complex protein [Mangrovicoccus algicola]MBE3640223.1 flagellar hook-basal body complex protein [Mangrovicoccus algicola]